MPRRFDIIIAPDGEPRTKPRALNVALRSATGRYLVVYDAEDRPDPRQLRLAVEGFANGSDRLGCLQARLAIDNYGDSWLPALFAMEYAALFDVINPGLARLGLPVPLGGTSNHFPTELLRRIGGWDAWNVTEDVDLGIRLARFGYRTAMLPSTTLEEAPRGIRIWLGQRRRWQKGWIATLRTHSRDLDRLTGDLGPLHAAITFAIVGGTVLSTTLFPVFVVWSIFAVTQGLLDPPRTPWQAVAVGAAVLLAASGLVALLWPILLGVRRRGLECRPKHLRLLLAYLMLASLATWQAWWESVRHPYRWTKTEHGTASHRIRPDGR